MTRQRTNIANGVPTDGAKAARAGWSEAHSPHERGTAEHKQWLKDMDAERDVMWQEWIETPDELIAKVNGTDRVESTLPIDDAVARDLAALVKKLIRHHRKGGISDELIAQAEDYLTRKSLWGSPLRED